MPFSVCFVLPTVLGSMFRSPSARFAVSTVVGLTLVLGHRADLLAADPSAVSTGGAAKAPASKVGGPPVPWKQMTAKQKGRYMKSVVAPNMKVLFQTFDGEQFKKFDCATCHGKDAQEKKFKMPSPDIHPLPPTPAAFEAMVKSKPTWPKFTKFMGEQVMPQMAAMLGQPVFNPKTPEAGGFGCRGCHTLSKS